MKLLIYISHPAQFHFYKHTIEALKSKGHQVDILAKTKDVLTKLIDDKGWKYRNILTKERGNSKLAICWSLLKRDITLLTFCFRKRYNLLLGTDASVAHVGKIMRIPVFTTLEDDYNIIPRLAKITYPFTTHIITPSVCNVGKWNDKKIAYSGFMKLAYLHPVRFKPKTKTQLGLSDLPYFLIRLSGLNAHHDFGVKGIHEEHLIIILKKLEKMGRVYISSETELPDKYKSYNLDIPVSEMHHYLANAEILVSDSQSMSVESSMLGTPSIRVSSFSGGISVLEELEFVYKLTFGFKPENIFRAFKKIDELLNTPYLKEEFEERRDAMLNDKIDVSAFLTWLITEYPHSINIMKEKPEYENVFIKPVVKSDNTSRIPITKSKFVIQKQNQA